MLNLPRHVAIVMDGNGRWAESRGLPRVEGHRAGVESVKAIIQSCLQKKIPCLSLFAFSSENWARPAEEVNFLMQLFIEALAREVEELHQYGIRLRFTGDRSSLSADLQAAMDKAEQMTLANGSLILNIVVNYGGKWDIVQAAKKLMISALEGGFDPNELDEARFAQALDTAGLIEPDLFIRTSGELRISNFFLWQLAYTELYFTEVYWPDFRAEAFEQALNAYGQRKRRFGQVAVPGEGEAC